MQVTGFIVDLEGEVCRRFTYELGEVPAESIEARLPQSIGSGLQVPLQLAPDPYRLCCLGDSGRCDLPGY
jgi:hypothetical protein